MTVLLEMLPMVDARGVVTFGDVGALHHNSDQLRRGVMTVRGNLAPGRMPLKLTAPDGLLNVDTDGRVVACVSGIAVITFAAVPAAVVDAFPAAPEPVRPPMPPPVSIDAHRPPKEFVSMLGREPPSEEDVSAAEMGDVVDMTDHHGDVPAVDKTPEAMEVDLTPPISPATAALPTKASVSVATHKMAVPQDPERAVLTEMEPATGRLQFESALRKEVPADVLRSIVGESGPVVVKPVAASPQDLPLLVDGTTVLYPTLPLLRAAEALASRGAILTRAKKAPQLLEQVTFALGVIGGETRVAFQGQVVMVRNGNAAVAFVDTSRVSQVFQDAAAQIESEGALPQLTVAEFEAQAGPERRFGDEPSKLVDVPQPDGQS